MNAIFAPDYENARAYLFKAAGSYSRAAGKAARFAANALICRKHDAEWIDFCDVLKDKTASRTVKNAVRRAISLVVALTAGAPVEGEALTYAIQEGINRENFLESDGARARWEARRDLLKDLDTIKIRVLKEDPTIADWQDRLEKLVKAAAAAGLAENQIFAAVRRVI